MAECSYARCAQQRRNIRRELQRWTKNMVHIVGLERIAEELMGRRKWKIYQDSMSRNYLQPLNNNIKRTSSLLSEDDCFQHYQKENNQLIASPKSRGKQSAKEEGEEEEEGASAEEPARAASPVAADAKENDAGDADTGLDWTPQSKCIFCAEGDGKLDSEHVAQHGVLSPRQSDSDSTDSGGGGHISGDEGDGHSVTSPTPPPRTPVQLNPATLPPNMTSVDVALALSALTGGGAGQRTPPGASHLPFYAPSMLTPSWYLANVARQFQATPPSADVIDKNCGSGEQPLDLSKGSSNTTANNLSSSEPKSSIVNNVRIPTLDPKQIFKAKPRISTVAGRRTYTEDELQAALRDIQSGKLGTRRAAVIYGIPRSTLRNKVYKLALERERESHLSTTPLKLDEDETMDDDKELSGAEEEKEVEKALQAPLLSMADILRFSGMDHPPDALKIFLQKAKESQDTQSEIIQYLQALLAPQNLLANQKQSDGTMPNQIPEFAKRLSEDHVKMQNNNGEAERLTRPSPSNSVITKVEKPRSESSDVDTEESTSNVILKIPSFKPTSSKNGCDIFRTNSLESSNRLVSPPLTTASESNSPPILPGKGLLIKDVISHSISQKFQQNLDHPPVRRPPPMSMDIDFKRGGFTPPLSGLPSVIKVQQEASRSYQQSPSHPPPPHQTKPPGPGGQPTGGKGTRPKRGKYRNYDRDSLVEAVRAVQRGEMSVHRAGSYYGVPHSTLEYKVKERHLMRPRKRDPKPNPVDEKIASLKQNDLKIAQEKLKQNAIKPTQQKFPPTSPNGIKLPIFEATAAGLTPAAAAAAGLGSYPHPFSFWPHPGFPPNPIEYVAAAAAARTPASPFLTTNPEIFASQMIQKLQEETSRTLGTPSPQGSTAALAKSTRQMAESLLDGSGSNGSFLDGIIRSSLESGVQSSDSKCLKEGKNITPEKMSNRALLDQLCRNSRLTPLTKPDVSETNSSEDESYRKGSSPLNFSTANNQDDKHRSSPHPINKSNNHHHQHQQNSDVHTIELSNDSNEDATERKQSQEDGTPERKHPRIYLKQELAKPENLKPEMLVRFREILPERNGGGLATECTARSSASDNDAPQD